MLHFTRRSQNPECWQRARWIRPSSSLLLRVRYPPADSDARSLIDDDNADEDNKNNSEVYDLFHRVVCLSAARDDTTSAVRLSLSLSLSLPVWDGFVSGVGLLSSVDQQCERGKGAITVAVALLARYVGRRHGPQREERLIRSECKTCTRYGTKCAAVKESDDNANHANGTGDGAPRGMGSENGGVLFLLLPHEKRTPTSPCLPACLSACRALQPTAK